jgi:hypothetical protein
MAAGESVAVHSQADTEQGYRRNASHVLGRAGDGGYGWDRMAIRNRRVNMPNRNAASFCAFLAGRRQSRECLR